MQLVLKLLRHLHLHLLSLDFDSPELKRPRHWIIFNTPYLVPPQRWASDLEQRGRVTVSRTAEVAVLKAPMACPLTGRTLADMPALHAHLQSSAYTAAVDELDADLVFM